MIDILKGFIDRLRKKKTLTDEAILIMIYHKTMDELYRIEKLYNLIDSTPVDKVYHCIREIDRLKRLTTSLYTSIRLLQLTK